MNISDYLLSIQELTNKNLKILETINNAFYSRNKHLSVNIDGTNYVIPSFLSLEDKLSSLEYDFDSLVESTKTGQATISFDGNTRKLKLVGYNNHPSEINLHPTSEFHKSSNDIFKDFLTPNVFMKMDMGAVPNSIKTVNIKKIALINPQLKSALIEGEVAYQDVRHQLYNYEEDKDYVEYDTLRRLPVQKGNNNGTYTIASISDHWTDADFVEHYIIELNEPLTYRSQDQTIENNIIPGDRLVTGNDSCQLEVEEVRDTQHKLKVKVLYNAFADLMDVNSGNAERYTLRFFEGPQTDTHRYVEVPLEEDTHIYVFVSPVNDDTNVQAPWGVGVGVNTSLLTIEENGVVYTFDDYYRQNVNNVGDALFSITSMFSEGINNLTADEFSSLTGYVPSANDITYEVWQINKHLNDSASVQKIRELYKQKEGYKTELNKVDKSLNSINDRLSKISFDDTTGTRAGLEENIAQLNEQRIQSETMLASVIDQIATEVNDATVPIENAKYHIRGYIRPGADNVVRVQVQYRYRNKNVFLGNATSMKGDFIYSDWNELDTPYLQKTAVLEGVSNWKFTYDEQLGTENKNLPSWNQIDIPITQGEIVDIRWRYIYDYCYPFAVTHSSWCEPIEVEFPTELLEDVTVMDIINENADEAKRMMVSQTLTSKGVTPHVDDRVQDQNITYFHSAGHIASGFYTEERRVIPLDTKLRGLDEDIIMLKAEITGQTSDNLVVSIVDDEQQVVLVPEHTNTFDVVALNLTPGENRTLSVNGSGRNLVLAYRQPTIQIYNAGAYAMKIYSIFPGNPTAELVPDIQTMPFQAATYSTETGGVWMDIGLQSTTDTYQRQTLNQFLYFRIINPFETTNNGYDYAEMPQFFGGKIPFGNGQVTDSWIDNISGTTTLSTYITQYGTAMGYDNTDLGAGSSYGSIYPYVSGVEDLCVESGMRYIMIQPGETKLIPLSFWFGWTDDDNTAATIERTIAFDIRTSLYSDPVIYEVTIRGDKANRLSSSKKRTQASKVNKPKSYNSTVFTAIKTNDAPKGGVIGSGSNKIRR